MYFPVDLIFGLHGLIQRNLVGFTRWIALPCILLLAGSSAACTGAELDGLVPAVVPPVAELRSRPTSTPFGPLPTATATPENVRTLWLAPYLSPVLVDALRLPPDYELVETQSDARVRLDVGDDMRVSWMVLALVAPFPTVDDGLSADQLRSFWREGGRPLLMAEETRSALAAWWGPPGEGAVTVLADKDLLDSAWGQPQAVAIIPFAALQPRWKVLALDGISPVRKGFDPAGYALSVPIALTGDPVRVAELLALGAPGQDSAMLPSSDRDPDKLTTLVMTGVTALVRATAFTMEIQGLTYPARDIGHWLRDADITHISNEVPFAQNCPPPDPLQEDLRFCSDPRYIELMDAVGTDVVELTGDHFQDWGTAAMIYTLDLYRERTWPYYGGGRDFAEGRQAVLMEHNGNRIAFIGCNGKGRPFAGATASSPGAVICDFPWMHAEIARLREEDVLPIVTFQHFEYYTYAAQPNQINDFGGMAEAGAVIVSGSQAHHPQALAFQDGAFIHYGLGNLFFDQLDVGPGTNLAFIDRHVIYDNRHISTELLTIIFEDYARARPMQPSERRELLRRTFAASGWSR